MNQKEQPAAVLSGPVRHASGEIARELGTSTRTAAPGRAGLIDEGMLRSPAYGMTAFTVPLFDELLLRRAEGSPG
ncbi:MAG: hypothetical protein M3165_11000 [Actinomycetota bacterium]|nr:hypothetical protein [Actinomycetota bacterium]